MSKSFTTKKGTVIPLLSLRGKPYMQVAHRLVWFSEENERYNIKTEFLSITESNAVAKAHIVVLDNNNNEIRTSSAIKSEHKTNFHDFAEKAETGAIGRALALLGYGTQFTGDELNEGSRLVDSPIDVAKKAPSNFKPSSVKSAPVASTFNTRSKAATENSDKPQKSRRSL